MIRIRQVEVPFDNNNEEGIKNAIAKKLSINIKRIIDYKINKKSLDARRKPNLLFIYELDIKLENELDFISNTKLKDVFITPNEEYITNITGIETMNNRPVIIGSGPAGLFCAYLLARSGYKPLVIERGSDVDTRVKDVENFWKTGKLNPESNVQFGEGGAGTFSDGKLNTGIKDNYNREKFVLESFVKFGAHEDILYVNKPHIGTDILRNVVKNMRNEIIKLGGEFKYNSCLTDINIKDNKLVSIVLNDKEIVNTDVLVLAIGHSARDTFNMLYSKKIDMQSKPFAIGVRVQHSQEMINYNQYGYKKHPSLDAASYKLTYKSKSGRGVYSFCMCPGGFVVNSSSEEGMLAINGMSNNARESENANSAIIVTISSKDYGLGVLDGIEFQRQLEEKTYNLGKGNIPIQLLKDYKNNNVSSSFGSINPIFKGNYNFANLREIFPNDINESLIEAMDYFNTKIKGFNNDDTILAAVESRTSSPVKIIRDDNGESSIKGIYPCGEGAGYAGGITSAAIDGIKVFEYITSKYKN